MPTFQLSATELNVGSVRASPVAVHATLANGILDVALAPSRLYGGEVQATLSVNASDEPPVHALHVDLNGVRALPLLSDLGDFGSLDGRLQSKIDVQASGNSGMRWCRASPARPTSASRTARSSASTSPR